IGTSRPGSPQAVRAYSLNFCNLNDSPTGLALLDRPDVGRARTGSTFTAQFQESIVGPQDWQRTTPKPYNPCKPTGLGHLAVPEGASRNPSHPRPRERWIADPSCRRG